MLTDPQLRYYETFFIVRLNLLAPAEVESPRGEYEAECYFELPVSVLSSTNRVNFPVRSIRRLPRENQRLSMSKPISKGLPRNRIFRRTNMNLENIEKVAVIGGGIMGFGIAMRVTATPP